MGFEVVVRPVVFPNIRPQSARVLPPENNPEQGLARIRGNPAQTVTFTHSYSFNWSSSRNVETERTVDEVRVYQQDDDGTINRDNFVDIEVAKKITKEGVKSESPGVDWKVYDSEREGEDKDTESRKRWQEHYKPIEEADNIEFRETDINKKNPDYKRQRQE